MVDLMGIEEQVDRDFALARRRARMRRLWRGLRGKGGAGKLLSFEEARRKMGVRAGSVRRGRATVEVARVVGSAGRHDRFDEGFMPLMEASRERWKRVDRAFRRGEELPPVSLYEIGGSYFVEDGNHRVSVARFHGVEWIDACVTEFRDPRLAAEHGVGAVPAQLRGRKWATTTDEAEKGRNERPRRGR